MATKTANSGTAIPVAAVPANAAPNATAAPIACDRTTRTRGVPAQDGAPLSRESVEAFTGKTAAEKKS
jgi:hypothetical protein